MSVLLTLVHYRLSVIGYRLLVIDPTPHVYRPTVYTHPKSPNRPKKSQKKFESWKTKQTL